MPLKTDTRVQPVLTRSWVLYYYHFIIYPYVPKSFVTDFAAHNCTNITNKCDLDIRLYSSWILRTPVAKTVRFITVPWVKFAVSSNLMQFISLFPLPLRQVSRSYVCADVLCRMDYCYSTDDALPWLVHLQCQHVHMICIIYIALTIRCSTRFSNL